MLRHHLVISPVLFGIAALVAAQGCATAPNPTPVEDTMDKPSAAPPVAPKKRHVTKIHGRELIDEYFWMRNRGDDEVIAYLNAENAYTDKVMKHTEDLQKTLYGEMLGRIKEDDASVPYALGPYLYYSRTESGKPYRIHCRKKGVDGAEEVILNVNDLASGHEYTAIGVLEVSPDHNLLAYSVDLTGGERYELHIKDLRTGTVLADTMANTYYGVAWGSDNATLFYVTVDDAMRPYRLVRHTVGEEASKDVVVHEETDDAYFVSVERSRSGGYIFHHMDSAVTSGVRVLDASAPTGDFRILVPRKQGVECGVDHQGEFFFLRTNDGAQNFKLMRARVDAPPKWEEVIAASKDVTLSGVAAFRDHLVISERRDGLPGLRIRRGAGDMLTDVRIDMPEVAYKVWLDQNPNYDAEHVRFGYTSLVTPRSIFDYDIATKTRTLKKEQPVPGYDRSLYETERIWATSPDGVKVPISLVHRRGAPRGGPLLLNGYGAYGISWDPSFSSSWPSLVDRGVTVAIAHVRGGGAMGRSWKEDGKFAKKINTFIDFIACAEHLVAEGYTTPKQLAISGGSAGGLLIGAVVNMRPELFEAAVASVPFVDVINTMLDETIPLTVIEWEEWGNPNNEADFNTMIAYSPYDNVAAHPYPNLLVQAGLNDPRVQYWEPAKWTAKLRAHKTDDNVLILKTNMGAGHGGASGRYGRLEELAFEYAFVLDSLGVKGALAK